MNEFAATVPALPGCHGKIAVNVYQTENIPMAGILSDRRKMDVIVGHHLSWSQS